MPIPVSCPKCHFSGSARESLSRKVIKCPKCGKRFQIGPAPDVPEPAAGTDYGEEPILLPDHSSEDEMAEQLDSLVIGDREERDYSRRKPGGGIAVLGLCVVVLLGAGIAFFFVAMNSQRQSGVAASPEKEVAGEEPTLTGSSALTKHRWWRVPMSPSKIQIIIAAISGLQKEHEETAEGVCLLLTSGGKIERLPLQDSGGPGKPQCTFGLLQGAGENAAIQFIPGERYHSAYLSADEAHSLLAKQLDAAYGSEQNYKKTGKGDTLIDQFLDTKAP